MNIRSRGKNVEREEEGIPKEYQSFNNQVFNKAVFDQLPNQSKQNHAIKLISNMMLKNCKIYPLNTKKQEKLNKFLKEHLKLG